jgi:hypothetical protein
MGRPYCREKILSRATRYKSNPTWNAVGLNHGFCYQKPETGRPSNKRANVCPPPTVKSKKPLYSTT